MGTELLTRKMDLIHSNTQTTYSWVDRLSFDTLYPTKISGIMVKAFIATSSYMKNTYGTNGSVVNLTQDSIKFIIQYGSEKIVEIPLKDVLDFEGNPFKSNGFIKGDYVLTIIDIDNKKIYLNSLMNADRNNLSSMSYIEKYRRELNYYCNGHNDNVVLQEIIDNLISFYDDRVNKDLNNEVKDKDGNIKKIRDEFDLSLTVDNKNNIFTNGKFTINIIGKFGIDYSQTKFTYGGFNRQNRSSIMTIRGTYTDINDYMRYDKNDKDMELILDWDKCYIPKIEYNNETCAALYNTKKYLRSNDGSVKYIDYWTEEEEAHFVDNNGIPYGNLFPRRLVFTSIEGILPLNITMKNLSLTTFGVGIYCETESKKILKILDSKINILSTASSISTDIPGSNSKFDITNDDNFYQMMPVPAGCAVDINCILPTVEINNCKFKNALSNRYSNLIINSCTNMKITNSFIKDFADYNDAYKDAFVTSCLDYEYFYDYEYEVEQVHTYEINSTGSIDMSGRQCQNPNFQDIIILSTLFYNDNDYPPRIRIPNKMILKHKTDDQYYTDDEFKHLDFADLLGNYCAGIYSVSDNLIKVIGDCFKVKSKFKGGSFGNTCAVIKNIPVLYRESNSSYYMQNVFNVNENSDYNNSLRLSDYHENSKNFFYGNKETEYMPNILIESSTIRAVGVLYQYNANTRISNTKIDAYFYGTAFSTDPINLVSGDLTISNCECNFDTRIEINNLQVKNIGDFNCYSNSYCPSFIKVYPIIYNTKDPKNDIPFYDIASSVIFDKNTEFSTYGNQLVSPSVTILTPSKLNISNSKFTLYPDTIFNIPRTTDNNTTIYMKRLNGEEIELKGSKTLRFISTISNDNFNEVEENLENNTRSFFNPNTAPNINIDSSEFLVVNNMIKRENMVYTLADRALCRVVKKLSNGTTTEYELYPEDLAHTGFYIYDYIPELLNNSDYGESVLRSIRERYNRFGVTAFKLENVIFNMNNCNIGSHSGNYIRNTYGYETMVRRTPRICFDFRSSGIYHINNTKANAWGTVMWSEIHNTAYSDYYNNYKNLIAPFDSSTIDLTNKGECIVNNCNFMNYSYLRFRRTSEDWIDYLDLDSYNKIVDGTSKKEIFDKSNKSYSLNSSELLDMNSLRKKELSEIKQQTFETDNSNYSNIQAYNESVRNANEMPIIYIANSPLVDTQINFGHIKGNETVIIEGNISFNNVNYHNNNNAMICYINKVKGTNSESGLSLTPPVVYFNNCEINATKDVIMDKYVDRDNGRENTRYRPIELDFSDRGMTKYNNVITPFYVETDECYLELNGNKITFKCNAYDDIYGIDSSARVRLLYYNKFNYIYNGIKYYKQSLNFINNTVTMLFDCPKLCTLKNINGENVYNRILPNYNNTCVIDISNQSYSENYGKLLKNININNNNFNIITAMINKKNLYYYFCNNSNNSIFTLSKGLNCYLCMNDNVDNKNTINIDLFNDQNMSNKISLNKNYMTYLDKNKNETPYLYTIDKDNNNFVRNYRPLDEDLPLDSPNKIFLTCSYPEDNYYNNEMELLYTVVSFDVPIIYSSPYICLNICNNFINNNNKFINSIKNINLLYRSNLINTYINFSKNIDDINTTLSWNILNNTFFSDNFNLLENHRLDDILEYNNNTYHHILIKEKDDELNCDKYNIILNKKNKNNWTTFNISKNILEDEDNITYDNFKYKSVSVRYGTKLYKYDNYYDINSEYLEGMLKLFTSANFYRTATNIKTLKLLNQGYIRLSSSHTTNLIDNDDVNYSESKINIIGLQSIFINNDTVVDTNSLKSIFTYNGEFYTTAEDLMNCNTPICTLYCYSPSNKNRGYYCPIILFGTFKIKNLKVIDSYYSSNSDLNTYIPMYRYSAGSNDIIIEGGMSETGKHHYLLELDIMDDINYYPNDSRIIDQNLVGIYFPGVSGNTVTRAEISDVNTKEMGRYEILDYYGIKGNKDEFGDDSIKIYLPLSTQDYENITEFNRQGFYVINNRINENGYNGIVDFHIKLKEGYLLYTVNEDGENISAINKTDYITINSENIELYNPINNNYSLKELQNKDIINRLLLSDLNNNNDKYSVKIEDVIFKPSNVYWESKNLNIPSYLENINVINNINMDLNFLNCLKNLNDDINLNSSKIKLNMSNNSCLNYNTLINRYNSFNFKTSISDTLSDIYGNIDS